MPRSIPVLDKEERPLTTMEEHDQLLVAACRAATAILMAQKTERRDKQEPLPESTIELLKSLPRI